MSNAWFDSDIHGIPRCDYIRYQHAWENYFFTSTRTWRGPSKALREVEYAIVQTLFLFGLKSWQIVNSKEINYIVVIWNEIFFWMLLIWWLKIKTPTLRRISSTLHCSRGVCKAPRQLTHAVSSRSFTLSVQNSIVLLKQLINIQLGVWSAAIKCVDINTHCCKKVNNALQRTQWIALARD